jgi:hypothetical protein
MTPIMLCLSLLTSPVDPAAAVRGCLHALHANQAVREHGGDVQTLLSVGYVESRWVRGLVSSAGCCGPWQVSPRWSGQTCRELDQPDVATRAAARALRYWRGQCKGNEACALRGYNCGWAGVRGACKGYPAKVGKTKKLLFGS